MQAWAGFASVGAVLYAAHKGAAKFEDWLRQKQTERRIAAAENALEIVYRLRRAFEAIRSPGYMGSAGPNAEAKLRESFPDYDEFGADRKGRLVWAQVILTRIHSYKGDWDRFFDCLPLAKAHFGDEVEASLNELWAQQAMVTTAAQQYGQHEELAVAFREQMEARLWQVGEEDHVNAKIVAAISKLEAILLPVIRSEVTPKTEPDAS